MSAARIVWQGENHRIVKRDTSKRPEVLFDVERRSTDALGEPAWFQEACFGIDREDNEAPYMRELLMFLDSAK